jgi:hypothetical protein
MAGRRRLSRRFPLLTLADCHLPPSVASDRARQRQRRLAEMSYLLVRAASPRLRPRYGSNLPSWSCGFRLADIRTDMAFLQPGGTPATACPAPRRGRVRLLGGGAGAVQDAGGGAEVHVQGDAVIGAADHAGHVGGVELPGEQGGGAEHVPQTVPGPLAAAGGVTPSGRQVGALEDVAVEVGRPPVLSRRGGEDQSQRVGADGLLGAGLLDAGGEPLGQRVADRRVAGRSFCGTCGSSAPPGTGAQRPR